MGDQWGSNPSYGYSGNNRNSGGGGGGGGGGYNNYGERRNYGGGGGGGGRDFQSGGGGGGGGRYYNNGGGRSFDGNNRRDFRSGSRPSGGGFNAEEGDATIMKVPTRFVGRIIGRGGSKINDLQFKSGARIQVTKDTEGDDTLVKLFGNSGEVSKAQDLISDLTVDY